MMQTDAWDVLVQGKACASTYLWVYKCSKQREFGVHLMNYFGLYTVPPDVLYNPMRILYVLTTKPSTTTTTTTVTISTFFSQLSPTYLQLQLTRAR